MRVAEAFLEVLDAAGARVFFGLPGSTEAALLEAARARQLHYVLALHEGVAVAMADGYARLSGRPGVVGLHTSVGTLNGLSQMQNALRDGSPLVVTAGHKDRQILSEEGFCALPGLLEAARAVSRWAHQSLSADAVPADLAHAFRRATTPPRGPAYLAIPEDLLAGEVERDLLEQACRLVAAPPVLSGAPRGDLLAAGAELLSSAERPVLVVGSAARAARPELVSLARSQLLPVLMTEFSDLADGPYPTGDPNYLGLYGEDAAALEGCDLVLAVGCRVFYPFSDRTRPRLPNGARLVHLHEDPGEIGRVLPAELAVAGDTALALRGLEDALRERGTLTREAVAARSERLGALRAGRDEARRGERLAASESPSPMRIESVAEVLNKLLPTNAVLVDEGVRSSRPLLRHLELGDEQLVLRSSGGSLGWGTPAAVGAKLAAPERAVLAVVGDGSFQFSVQALWSAVRCEQPLTVVVLDNGGYLAVKRAVESFLGVPHDPRPHPGTAIEGIDHAAIAAGYGAIGVHAADPGGLAEAIASGLSGEGVTVVHARVAQVRP